MGDREGVDSEEFEVHEHHYDTVKEKIQPALQVIENVTE